MDSIISRKGDFFVSTCLEVHGWISGVEKKDMKYKEIKIQAH